MIRMKNLLKWPKYHVELILQYSGLILTLLMGTFILLSHWLVTTFYLAQINVVFFSHVKFDLFLQACVWFAIADLERDLEGAPNSRSLLDHRNKQVDQNKVIVSFRIIFTSTAAIQSACSCFQRLFDCPNILNLLRVIVIVNVQSRGAYLGGVLMLLLVCYYWCRWIRWCQKWSETNYVIYFQNCPDWWLYRCVQSSNKVISTITVWTGCANHNRTVQTLQRRRGNVLMTVINRSWLVLLQQQQQLGHQNVTCVMVGTFTSYNAILSSFLTAYLTHVMVCLVSFTNKNE